MLFHSSRDAIVIIIITIKGLSKTDTAFIFNNILGYIIGQQQAASALLY